MWWSVFACEQDEGPGPRTEPHSADASAHTADELVTDELSPAPMPADLLLVVDNSCGMADDQVLAVEQLAPLLTDFQSAGLDWRLAATTTDLDGSYRGARGSLVEVGGGRWVAAGVPDPEAALRTLVLRGEGGASAEQGSGAAYGALEPSIAPDPDFRRPDATLHVLVISDEPDLTRAGFLTEDAFVAWFAGQRPAEDERAFHAFVSASVGGKYRQFAEELGGVFQDLAATDWSRAVEALGEQVAVVGTSLTPSAAPRAATLSVTRHRAGTDALLMEGADWSWDADAGAVVLTARPEVGDTFTLAYVPE